MSRSQSRYFPLCVDWLPDGRLLLVSARDGLVLRQETDDSLATHADVTGLSDTSPGNEMVLDGRGNVYVNGGGFDLMAGEEFAPGIDRPACRDAGRRGFRSCWPASP